MTKLVSYATGGYGGSDEPYECKSCGARFSERYHECPECESYRVERKEWSLID